MTLSFLWTDRCFLTVIFLAALSIAFSLRKAHVRQSYAMIGQDAVAVSAGLVLLFFLMIAVLDSVHIHMTSTTSKAGKTMTLLDKILWPLGSQYEKTYSAPLALHSYTSETEMQHQQAKQIYPRLKFVSAKLQTAEEKLRLIQLSAYQSFLWAGIITGIFWLLAIFWRLLMNKSVDFSLNKALIAVLLTVFVLAFLTEFSLSLSRNLHILGTGKIGQDIFYYAVKSIRTGLVIGLLTTLFMMPLALFLGLAAGYYGGIIDDLIQYVYTVLSSIPGVLLITAAILSMQTYIANHPAQFTSLLQSADARLLALCLILGVTSWTSLCRLIRAESLKLREVDFVQAAKISGRRSLTILVRHLLPNVMHIVLITLVLDFSFLVLAEAVLTYVGVGVSPLTISWGNMINGARLELAREPIVWWPMLAAFSFMFVLVLSSNLFADALRDAFDPYRR